MSTVLDLLQDGRNHQVSLADYENFLDVLPPVCLDVAYRGERWDFGFAEGADFVRLFKRQADYYYAIQTPYINPYEAGDFSVQQHRWILQWIKVASRNRTLRRAGVPLLTTSSFHACGTDEELLDQMREPRGRAGEALYIDNLCFIKLADDGNSWLAIKDGTVMAGLTFDDSDTAEQRADGQKVIDDLRAFTVVQLQRRAGRFAP